MEWRLSSRRCTVLPTSATWSPPLKMYSSDAIEAYQLAQTCRDLVIFAVDSTAANRSLAIGAPCDSTVALLWSPAPGRQASWGPGMPGNRNGACSSRLRPRTTCTQLVSSGLASRSSANVHPCSASGNGVVLGVVSSGASRSYISLIHHRHASGGAGRDSSAAGH